MVSVAECEGMHVALFPLSPCVLSLSLISLATLSSCVTESETMRVALSFSLSLSLSFSLLSLVLSSSLPSSHSSHLHAATAPPPLSLLLVDLWLNEGFASWMMTFVADVLFPSWAVWPQYCSNEMARAMSLDSLRTSHPIQVPIKEAEEVEQVFGE